MKATKTPWIEPVIVSVLPHVPIGEKQAMSALEIWRRYGRWAKTTVRSALDDGVTSGVVKRRMAPDDGHGMGARWLFWRDA